MIPATVIMGVNDWTRMPMLYVLAVSVLTLNQMRLLADHHLESDGKPLSMHDHILDSCNFSKGDVLVWLFFPFAIRYHALHHLFPTLPYHNLKAAHAHLSAELAEDSPYHDLDRPNWWSVARQAFGPRSGSPTRTAAKAA
jgi:fatty acid desaturase